MTLYKGTSANAWPRVYWRTWEPCSQGKPEKPAPPDLEVVYSVSLSYPEPLQGVFPFEQCIVRAANISSQKEQTGYCLVLIHLITRAAPEPLDSPSLLTQNNDGEQEARGTGKRKRKTSYTEKSQGFSLPLPPLVSKKALSCETCKEVFAG